MGCSFLSIQHEEDCHEKEKTKTLEYYMQLPYQMVITPDPDEGGYVISFPDLRGCLTCVDTFAEIYDMAEDAKRCRFIPHKGGKGCAAWICPYLQSCFCGWQQTNRSICDAEFPGTEWYTYRRDRRGRGRFGSGCCGRQYETEGNSDVDSESQNERLIPELC